MSNIYNNTNLSKVYIMDKIINTKIKKWQYINFENRSLTIPRNLMKLKNKNLPDFKVPLSDEALNILKNQYQCTSHQE